MAARRTTISALLLLAVATILVYRPGLGGPFVFDDVPSIVTNGNLASLATALREDLAHDTVTAIGRPFLRVTFWANRATAGLDPGPYRAVNVALHACAAFALFGLTRRLLRSPPLAERHGTAADGLALAVALLWSVHPLQTESVSYVAQRAEVLGALFYLLTLYGVARCASATGRPAKTWGAAAVLACLLGMASKETVATAPILAVALDRTFFASSWAELRRRRGPLHLALAATWVAQAWLVAGSMGRRGTVGLGLGLSWWEYAYTQPFFLCRYLRLALWPDALAFDYGMHRVTSVAEGLPYAVVVGALLALTVVALWRRPALGFCGAWFFLALAPSSSVVPIASQTGAEHRMYLALAGLVAPAVVHGYAILGRFFAGRRLAWVAAVSLAGLTLALGMRTWTRNHDYRSVRALWQTSVDAWPGNPRAHYNLGLESDEADALVHYEEAIQLAPDHFEAYVARGNVLRKIGRVDEAIASYQRALLLRPDFAEAHNNLANVLGERGDLDAAIAHYASARRSRPDVAVYALNEGLTLARAERQAEAVERFDDALRVEPENASIHFERGRALVRAGRPDEGIAALERATEIEPDDARYAAALGQELARIGRFDEASRALARAVFLEPRSARRRIQVADALVAGGNAPAAFTHYEEAIRLEPRAVQAHAGLAAALARTGRVPEAIAEYERAAQLDGGRDPDLLAGLAAAYAEAGRLPDAISNAERAVERAQELGDAARMERLEAQLARYRSDASSAAGATAGREGARGPTGR